ncbi:DNA phosphorothioation-dependent restriction protein DptF [Providencia rettgeri]|uniref:DNA phosphorothioation-dependent restriction protein DptF n=1 Tax=Morganellaceae TaxID=1903414 RepID=UPI0034DDA946
MSTITLRNALKVLAKSSSLSVTTETDRKEDVFDELKKQLFVKQEIEVDLQNYLNMVKQGEVVFLCGSSGDGKSEILTRCKSDTRYQNKFRFHLDATHSFAPRQSAIEALNNLFDEHEFHARPLLIGINTGMLANFAREGAEHHKELRSTIDSFLSGKQEKNSPYQLNGCSFFDFEHYPKFHFDEEKRYSSFIKSLLVNLTESGDENLFHMIFRNEETLNPHLREVANFKLLCMPGVQDVIITQLFKARLIKEQFVTTRTLLDFFHHLIMGPGYLFDNLFTTAENTLINKISDFDPARLHTYELDQFILRYELGLADSELDGFLAALKSLHIKFDRQNIKPYDAISLIRAFWLLQHESLGNNYHRKFSVFFNESLLEHYSEIWLMHKNYTASSEQKKILNRFYSTELIAGIQCYANRKAPELSMQKEEFFLGEFGGIKLTAPVEIKPDWDAILNKYTTHPTAFFIHLKVGQKALPPVQIGLNLFELLHKLNNGYRPNKYDKNAIVLLDELVELIIEQAKSSRDLKFYGDGKRVYRAKADDGMITISGMEG